WFDRVSRLDWLVRHAVAGSHEVSVEFLFENFDLREPFAGGGTNPSGYHGARGKAVVLGQGRAIQVGGDERIGVHRLFDRNATDKGRHFARDFVEATEHYVLARGLGSCALEQCAETRAAETTRANGAFLPLHAWHLRRVKGAAVAGTLQSVHNRVSFEFRKFRKRDRVRLLHFSANRELPRRRVKRARFVHVVPDEEMLHRREPRVEVLDGCFKIEETIRADDQVFFSWNGEAPGVCGPGESRS